MTAQNLRAVHFDLKGLPPTATRFVELLRIAAAGGYNAALLEWEDTFPWRCDPRFRAPWAYSEDDVARILDAARKLDIEMIPLVQCLGHMETPLTVPDYAHLREEPFSAMALSAAAPGARELVQKMVDDVLALSTPRWFHLGGDEAWSFGRGEAAQRFLATGGTKAQLYLQHVEPILDALIARNVRPILWHDMMSTWDDAALRQLAKKCDLMVWGYSEHPDTTKHHYRREVIEKFCAAGVTQWSANAFKGAEGANRDLPDLQKRCDNALAWAQVSKRHNFTGGAVATGWTRYSTHRLQCEPIDGSLDALIAVGTVMRDGATMTSKPQFDAADIERLRGQALDTLRTLGELESFEKLHATLSELQTARNGAWTVLRDVREQLAVIAIDPARTAAGNASDYLKHAARWISRVAKAGDMLRVQLTGKVADACITSYIRERLDPLTQQLAELSAKVAPLEPGAHAALKSELKKDAIEF